MIHYELSGAFFHGRNDRRFTDAFYADAQRYGRPAKDLSFAVRSMEHDLKANEARQRAISESFDKELKGYYEIVESINSEIASGQVYTTPVFHLLLSCFFAG